MHTTELRVRTYECDAYGHVNNAVYLNYLELARDQFIADRGLDYSALLSSGHGIWVSEAKLTYLSPALPGETLRIVTIQHESGGAWATLKQTIEGPSKRPVLEALMKLVWVGPNGRPTRIPSDWRERLSRGV